MTVQFSITLLAGILSLTGLIGIVAGAAGQRTTLRKRAFRVGSVAMGMAGLVLLLGGLFGVADTGQMFGGVMLLIFGTAVGLPAATEAKATAENAHAA